MASPINELLFFVSPLQIGPAIMKLCTFALLGAAFAQTYELPISYKNNLFYASFEVGSNREKVTVQVDTGSSDFWLMSKSNNVCSYQPTHAVDLTARDQKLTTSELSEIFQEGKVVGNGTTLTQYDHSSKYLYCPSTFDETKSCTFFANQSEILFTFYLDNTFTYGSMAKDTITIQGDAIEDFPFGIAYTTTTSYGVLGLSYPGFEYSAMRLENVFQYANFPVYLKNSGRASSVSYAIYCSPNTMSGSVLFGGYDPSKFKGDLVTVPMEDAGTENFSRILVRTTVKLNPGLTANDTSIVLMSNESFQYDTGTVGVKLSNSAYTKAVTSLNGNPNMQHGAFSCKSLGNPYLEICHDGFSYTVPIQFVRYGDSDLCSFGTTINDPDVDTNVTYLVLGAEVFTQIYTYFDLSKYEVSFGQSRFSRNVSNIVKREVSIETMKDVKYLNTAAVVDSRAYRVFADSRLVIFALLMLLFLH